MIGRVSEYELILKTLLAGRNLLIEGPVGVGKTFLVREALRQAGREMVRVDGDSRYTEQKLTGWFDPPQVLKIGYQEKCFNAGPLVEAMGEGKVLFINELNRMPEAVQNILLPALDEHLIQIPHIGVVHAKPGFCVIGTQNPKEFTATVALAEALLDRFELLRLGYQSQEEEVLILTQRRPSSDAFLASSIVEILRVSRSHSAIRRGASLRAGIAISDLVATGVGFEQACLMALSSRMELISPDHDPDEIIKELISGATQKKKH
jgi:MoxR-like ATPase